MERKFYLMKCGHIAQGITSDKKPCCVICAGIKPTALEVEKIVDSNEALVGRKAHCTYCNKEVDSSWDLPFFSFKPNEKYDEYYCGCFGWD